jgi:hypothetical protein
MATGEDELEPLIRDCCVVELIHGHLGHIQQSRLLGQAAGAADPIDCAVAGSGDEPGGGVVRDAVPLPALCGNRECLRGGFLGEIEVAEEADQRGQYATPLLAEDVLEQR